MTHMTSEADPTHITNEERSACKQTRRRYHIRLRRLTTIDITPAVHRPHLTIRDELVGGPSDETGHVGAGGGDGRKRESKQRERGKDGELHLVCIYV